MYFLLILMMWKSFLSNQCPWFAISPTPISHFIFIITWFSLGNEIWHPRCSDEAALEAKQLKEVQVSSAPEPPVRTASHNTEWNARYQQNGLPDEKPTRVMVCWTVKFLKVWYSRIFKMRKLSWKGSNNVDVRRVGFFFHFVVVVIQT